MGARSYYVYILASRIGGTLYIGVTNDLVRRVAEHKSKTAESFTKQYDVIGWFITKVSMGLNRLFIAKSG
jgi:putative endonuclease